MTRRLFACLSAALLAVAPAACGPPAPEVELRTAMGVIRIELDSVRAPRTVENFLRYVDQGRFEGASFYRVRRDEAQLMRPPTGVVQGGLWGGDSTRLLPPIPFEPTRRTGLRHEDGTVSMARFGDVGSARGEFFIVVGDQPHLDYRDPAAPGYAAFGRVVQGMEVVRAIQEQPARGEILRTPIPFRAVRAR